MRLHDQEQDAGPVRLKHWSAELVGLPWQAVRPGPGYRCWSLVAQALAAHGLLVPDYEGAEASQSELQELQTIRDDAGEWPWVTIVGRGRFQAALLLGREFDVMVFRGRGLHAGILTAPGEMLHIEEGGLSRLTNLKGFEGASWRARFLGLYRHIDLA